MSTSMIALGVTVKLFDQLSGGMGRIVQQVDGLRGKLEAASRAGRQMFGSGMIAAGTLAKPVAAFASLEDASTRLRAVMMNKDGTTGAFEKVNALATKLGDQLPGTTADFLNMMAALKAQGISDESILGGVGESAAKMAVLLKKTPEEMAVFSAKLKTALGVADSDMLAFMDTIQRTYFMGVDATEMMYAFARSGGALKTIKQQGLEAGKALAPLFAIWVKGGLSGETVGTGFASITASLLDAKKMDKANALLTAHNMPALKFTDKKGNFLGIENMIKEFDKLKGLSAGRLNSVLKEIFGGGQDQQMIATLVTTGIEGYRKQVKAMEAQADLQMRVGAQLKTLTNLWEAASGTFTNLLASLGEAMGDDLKALTEWFGRLSESIKGFVKDNPLLFGMIGKLALMGTGMALVAGAIMMVAGALGTLVVAFSAVSPFLLALALLTTAAVMIYANWEPIKDFFIGIWDGIWSYVGAIIDNISAKFGAFADWVLEKILGLSKALASFSLSNLLPDWMKGGGPVATVKLAGDAMGPARPAAVTPGQSNVGGKIEVEIKDPGNLVSGVSARSDNRDVPLSVDNGLAMMAP